MNQPDEPVVEERMNPLQYAWHVLQLAAWYLWPENDCPYCWFYRGVGIGITGGFLLGYITKWAL